MGEGRQDWQDTRGHAATERVSVQEAAIALGTTVDAIRKRVQRETITYEKAADGRVWILLDTGQTRQVTDQDATGPGPRPDPLLVAKDETIQLLREQLEAERRANEENRRIIAALTSRIPQLEAPSEPPEAPTEDTEQPGRGEPQPPLEDAQEPSERPWWRRMFGG